MKSNKGNVLVIILAIIAVIALAVAGYFFYQNKQPQKPKVETVASDEIANWKTYISPFGFSVKYPTTWYADTENSKLINFMSLSFEEFKKINLEQNINKYASVFIFVFESTETIEARAAKQAIESISTETASINGLKALKIKKKPSFLNGIYYEYLFKDKTGGLTISIRTETIRQELQPVLDQILGTFRFL